VFPREPDLEEHRDHTIRAQAARAASRAPERTSRRAHRARREERVPLTNFQQSQDLTALLSWLPEIEVVAEQQQRAASI
jgi:hypothetical protein